MVVGADNCSAKNIYCNDWCVWWKHEVHASSFDAHAPRVHFADYRTSSTVRWSERKAAPIIRISKSHGYFLNIMGRLGV